MARRAIRSDRLIAVLGVAVIVLGTLALWFISQGSGAGFTEEPSALCIIGETIPLNDSPDVVSFFKDTWQNNTPEDVVQKVLSNNSFWDQDLTKIKGLQDLVIGHVRKLIV